MSEVTGQSRTVAGWSPTGRSGGLDGATIEERLRERLQEVPLQGVADGERAAAGAAIAGLAERFVALGCEDPPQEMLFGMPDPWSVMLFIALCRRYGLRPYRHPGQRQTTIMVRAPRRFFEAVVWTPFQDLHCALQRHLQETSLELIRTVVHPDTSDAAVQPEADA